MPRQPHVCQVKGCLHLTLNEVPANDGTTVHICNHHVGFKIPLRLKDGKSFNPDTGEITQNTPVAA